VDEVMVYAIGLAGETLAYGRPTRTKPAASLKKLASETGGGYFELSRADQLTSTFTRVALELHSQYVLGFTPQALDGKPHTLEVRVKKPGMTARARKSYVAS
jgi:VWFA-related protein